MTPPFLWGAATSSHQIEGYNDKNDWWAWEAEGKIEGGARSGAATDHWNRFAEDIRLAWELGLNSYRFSIEWSRIEPEEGRWDQSAVDWYRGLIAECEKRQLVPMITLHHFTSPKWFADRGGFRSSDSPELFGRYVVQVAKALGREVPLWCTFNEPMVLVIGGYLGKFMPPALFAPELVPIVCANLLRAHVIAYEALHKELGDVAVGIAHNMLYFQADRPLHPLERTFTWIFNRFYNRSWLDAITGRRQNFSIPGLIPRGSQVTSALERATADFVGLNYYTKAYVKWRPRDSAEGISPDIPVGISFARRQERTSDVGWSVHPSGLRETLRMASGYGLPIYVTENGIADREDQLRADFIRSHVAEVARACESGMDIRGYYHWSLLDNFEWIKGFGPRFGLYAVDYDTFARSPRRSAAVYRDMIDLHRDKSGLGAPATERLARLGLTEP